MDPEVRKAIIDRAHRRLGRDMTFQRIFELLCDEAFEAGERDAQGKTPAWLSESLNSGDGTYKP